MDMDTAFCCVTRRTGTLIVGLLSLVSTITIAILTVVIDDEDCELDAQKTSVFPAQKDMLSRQAWYIMVFSLIGLNTVFSAILLYGTHKGRPCFLMPYIIFSVVLVGLVSFHGILIAMQNGWQRVMIFKLVHIAVSLYFTSVVWSHYGELQSKKRPSKNGAHRSQQQHPASNVPMIYYVIMAIFATAEIVAIKTQKDDLDQEEWALGGHINDYSSNRKLNDKAIYTIVFLNIGLNVVIIASLLFGTYKKRPGFLMPYMVLTGLKVAIQIICILIVGLSSEAFGPIWIIAIIDTALSVYFIAVVAGYYGELRSGNVEPPKYEP